MTLRQTDNYMRVCMKSWLLCEACVHSEKVRLWPDEKLIKICNDCAQSCIAFVAHFIKDPETAQKKVFDCYLFCRECYEECILHPEADIIYCGEVCDRCAETIKELMFLKLN